MPKLTVADIRKAVQKLEENIVPPGVVKTKKQALLMNAADKLIGLESDWKVGDTFYKMKAHPKIEAYFASHAGERAFSAMPANLNANASRMSS